MFLLSDQPTRHIPLLLPARRRQRHRRIVVPPVAVGTDRRPAETPRPDRRIHNPAAWPPHRRNVHHGFFTTARRAILADAGEVQALQVVPTGAEALIADENFKPKTMAEK